MWLDYYLQRGDFKTNPWNCTKLGPELRIFRIKNWESNSEVLARFANLDKSGPSLVKFADITRLRLNSWRSGTNLHRSQLACLDLEFWGKKRIQSRTTKINNFSFKFELEFKDLHLRREKRKGSLRQEGPINSVDNLVRAGKTSSGCDMLQTCLGNFT